MSLRDWLANHWLSEHITNRQEIADMLAAIKRDLSDCAVEGLSSDWRMSIAYSAALKIATAALASVGYRAIREQHHYRVIQSLAFTINSDPVIIDELDQLRKKRNISTYEYAGTVTDYEADRMIEIAEALYDSFIKWLHEIHPELID